MFMEPLHTAPDFTRARRKRMLGGHWLFCCFDCSASLFVS